MKSFIRGKSINAQSLGDFSEDFINQNLTDSTCFFPPVCKI